MEAVSFDDRAENPNKGVGEIHFGFAYFSDDRRVTYTNKGVGPGTGGWMPITPTHIRIAKAFLENAGMLDSGFPGKDVVIAGDDTPSGAGQNEDEMIK